MTTKISEEVRRLKPSQLEPSEWNRNDLGAKNGELKELASSIEEHGILMPLIVRQDKAGKYEIVCGHRRHAAAVQLKMADVPCIVKALSDAEALTYQIIENLQRKNLGPIEEARAFKQLTETAGCQAAGVAKMVDKSEKYVNRAIALLDLPAAAIKAMEHGKITAAHGHQLLRVGPKQIDTIVKFALTPGWKGDMPTVSELEREIETKATKDLRTAPFPKDKEYAGKIACTGCQYNTGNQDVLFDEAEEGHCTNGVCFNAKVAQSGKDIEEKAKAKHPDLKWIGVGSRSWHDVQTIKDWIVVEADLPKIKKALKETPEKFGVGVLKGGRYDSKKPQIVILTSDRKLAGVKDEQVATRAPQRNASPEELARDKFLDGWMEKAVALQLGGTYPFAPDLVAELVRVAWTDAAWNQEALVPYFEATGITVDRDMDRKEILSAIETLGPEQRGRLLMWILIVTNEDSASLITAIADANEMDLDKVRKAAYASGEEVWTKRKEEIMAGSKKEAVTV